MLRSCLPPTAYFDPDIFKLEQDRLFGELWIFAGLRSDTQTSFARRIGGVGITVSSDADGALSAIETFADSGGASRRVHVAQLGKMVFINLAERPIPVEEQFSSEFQAMLKESSSYFDNRYVYTSFNAKYNWKLNFENVMDYNHLPFIHAKSFNKMLDVTPVRPSEQDFAEDVTWDAKEDHNAPKLSDLSYSLAAPLKVTSPWFLPYIERYPAGIAKTWNWYTYPNLNYGCLEGNQFYLEQYMPLSPRTTEYHLWIVTAKRTNKRTNTTALLVGMMKAHKAIVDEDKVYLEKLQNSLHPLSERAMYGRHELAIYRAGRWYDEHILHP